MEAMNAPDEPSELRRIVRDLPKKRATFVVLVVLANLCVGSYWRGGRIADARYPGWPTWEHRRKMVAEADAKYRRTGIA